MLKNFSEFVSQNENKLNLLNKLINYAWQRYNPESKDFFGKLANKDPDIRSIIEELQNSKSDQEVDVISKNTADSNFGTD